MTSIMHIHQLDLPYLTTAGIHNLQQWTGLEYDYREQYAGLSESLELIKNAMNNYGQQQVW